MIRVFALASLVMLSSAAAQDDPLPLPMQTELPMMLYFQLTGIRYGYSCAVHKVPVQKCIDDLMAELKDNNLIPKDMVPKDDGKD